MPAAVRTPSAATLLASSTAWPIGSLPLWRDAAGAVGGRCACGRARGAGFLADDVEAVARFFGGAGFFARAVEPRFLLLRPGLDRGRLPIPPGSSFPSAATSRKIPVGAASCLATSQ